MSVGSMSVRSETESDVTGEVFDRTEEGVVGTFVKASVHLSVQAEEKVSEIISQRSLGVNLDSNHIFSSLL